MNEFQVQFQSICDAYGLPCKTTEESLKSGFVIAMSPGGTRHFVHHQLHHFNLQLNSGRNLRSFHRSFGTGFLLVLSCSRWTDNVSILSSTGCASGIAALRILMPNLPLVFEPLGLTATNIIRGEEIHEQLVLETVPLKSYSEHYFKALLQNAMPTLTPENTNPIRVVITMRRNLGHRSAMQVKDAEDKEDASNAEDSDDGGRHEDTSGEESYSEGDASDLDEDYQD